MISLSAFRLSIESSGKSSTGQSVCCSSEPSDSTLKSNCCSDNSSRSYCCCSIPSGTSNITTDTQRNCCLSLVNSSSCSWNTVCCSMCAQTHQDKYNKIYEKCGCTGGGGGGGSSGGSTPKIRIICSSPTSCGCATENLSPGSIPSNVHCAFTSTCGGAWGYSNGGHSPGSSCSISYSGYVSAAGNSCKNWPGRGTSCSTPSTGSCMCSWTLNYCAIVKYNSTQSIITEIKKCPIVNNKCDCSTTSW